MTIRHKQDVESCQQMYLPDETYQQFSAHSFITVNVGHELDHWSQLWSLMSHILTQSAAQQLSPLLTVSQLVTETNCPNQSQSLKLTIQQCEGEQPRQR